MKNAIYPLFPYPRVIPGRRYERTAAEKEIIAGLELTHNEGNRMSKSDAVLDSESLAALRRFIDEQLFNYRKILLHIGEDNEIYITQSWLNSANAGQFDSEEGMLRLVPSLLEHDVEKNDANRNRSSISFNTDVRGTLCSKGNLTEVSIT